MAKQKVKKTSSKNKKNGKAKDSDIKTAREKMIGQHIGYRYDVNLLPDYNRLTPFLKKFIYLFLKICKFFFLKFFFNRLK